MKEGEDEEEAEKKQHGEVVGRAVWKGAAWWEGRSGEAVCRVVLRCQVWITRHCGMLCRMPRERRWLGV